MAILNEDDWPAQQEAPRAAPALESEGQQSVANKQNPGRHQASQQRGVTGNHRGLYRAAKNHDHDELDKGKLGHLAATEEAEAKDQKEIDDQGVLDNLGQRSKLVEHLVPL